MRVLLVLSLAWHPLPAQEIGASLATDYTRGRYLFDAAFRTITVTGGLSMRRGRWSLSGSLPVMAVDGTALTRVAGVMVPTGGPDALVVRRRARGETVPTTGRHRRGPVIRTGQLIDADSLVVTGPGAYTIQVADPLLGGGITVWRSRDGAQSLDLEGWAKAPIGSTEAGVSTGAWDVGAGGTLLLGRNATVLTVGTTWWRLGDLPRLPLRHPLTGHLGFGVSTGAHTLIMVQMNGSTRVVPTVAAPLSVGATIQRGLTGAQAIHASVQVGLTEGAPTVRIGGGWNGMKRRTPP